MRFVEDIFWHDTTRLGTILHERTRWRAKARTAVRRAPVADPAMSDRSNAREQRLPVRSLWLCCTRDGCAPAKPLKRSGGSESFHRQFWFGFEVAAGRLYQANLAPLPPP